MRLHDLALQYAMKNGVSPGYLEQLSVFTKRLDWQVADITTEWVDAYLTDAMTNRAPQTVANHRRILTTLMRYAKRQGLNTRIRKKFRRVKVPAPLPVAFSLDDIRRLVEAARETPGHFRDLRKSDFLVAWFLTAYCTGLRVGDLIDLRWDQIRGARIYVRQSKTSRPHTAILTDEAILACKALPRRAKVFGDFAAKNTIQQWVAACVESAGLQGSTKWLRRSCATYAKVMGMSPKAKLGHMTDGLAERHYVDQALYEEETGLNSTPLPEVLKAKH